MWEFLDKGRLNICQEVECISVNYEKSCDNKVPAIGLTMENELELIYFQLRFS